MSENKKMTWEEAIHRLVTMDFSGLHKQVCDVSQKSSDALEKCLQDLSKKALGGETST